jgi:PAP2 superfamily
MTSAAAASLPARATRRLGRWLSVRHTPRVELVLVLGLYGLYEATRGLVAGGRGVAVRHARDVVSLERTLHWFVEGNVQHAAEHVPGLVGTLCAAYLTFHLALTGAVLLWLHWRCPAAYPFVRTTLLLASAIAAVGYIVFPTAPPRLAGLGILDTVTGHAHVNLNKGLVSPLYNPNAAMPSMHAGYALVVGATLLRHGRHLLTRLVGLAYPGFIVFVIVATGNHFLLDAAAGALVVVVAAGMTALLLRRPAPELVVLGSRRQAAAPDRLAA